MKRLTALFLTQLGLIMAIGVALNLNFCNAALASNKNCALVAPPGDRIPPPTTVKKPEFQQPEVKAKVPVQAESSSVISKLLSFDMPKTTFGDFVLSAQKALLEKLSNDGPASAPPPCGKTSQYIKNGVLRNN